MTGEKNIVKKAAAQIAEKSGVTPETVIVAGTGLSGLADGLIERTTIDYSTIEGFPVPCVASHKGMLVFGEVAGKGVVVLQGRSHLYEGLTAAEVVRPIRALAMNGAKNLLITNCAGALNPKHKVPSMMLIEDHINKTGQDPSTGLYDDFGPGFVEMTRCYDRELLGLASKATRGKSAIPVYQGIYVAVHGPSLETAAERRMLHAMGADAVGMSTVHEVIAARQADMRVLGVSALANVASGGKDQPIDSIKSILDSTKLISASISKLLFAVLHEMS